MKKHYKESRGEEYPTYNIKKEGHLDLSALMQELPSKVCD
jgi:hypothetical protein